MSYVEVSRIKANFQNLQKKEGLGDVHLSIMWEERVIKKQEVTKLDLTARLPSAREYFSPRDTTGCNKTGRSSSTEVKPEVPKPSVGSLAPRGAGTLRMSESEARQLEVEAAMISRRKSARHMSSPHSSPRAAAVLVCSFTVAHSHSSGPPSTSPSTDARTSP